VRCPGHTIHFMRLGYKEYLHRVVKLTGPNLSAREVKEKYDNWRPYY